MIILFDTDVVLDLLLDRQPFSGVAAELFSRVEKGSVTGYVCATTVTTVHYLAGKAVGAARAKRHIRDLLALLEVAPVNRPVIEGALHGKYHDFEDGVIAEAAHHVGATAIVTRNVRDFRVSVVPVYSPTEMVKMLRASGEAGR
jgi:predicted nucleic acid-binding protein